MPPHTPSPGAAPYRPRPSGASHWIQRCNSYHEVSRAVKHRFSDGCGWQATMGPMARRHTPFRNNAPLILLCAAAALLILLGTEVVLRTSRDFSPDFLASVMLYGLTVVDLTLLLVLVFVLGRNLVRVVMERR